MVSHVAVHRVDPDQQPAGGGRRGQQRRWGLFGDGVVNRDAGPQLCRFNLAGRLDQREAGSRPEGMADPRRQGGEGRTGAG